MLALPLKLWSIASSFAFLEQPQTNGVAVNWRHAQPKIPHRMIDLLCLKKSTNLHTNLCPRNRVRYKHRFTRQFRKIMGVTPTVFRRQLPHFK